MSELEKVDDVDKAVLDFVDRDKREGTWDGCIDKMYRLEKYIASGGKIDAVGRVHMRQQITEMRQYLQRIINKED